MVKAVFRVLFICTMLSSTAVGLASEDNSNAASRQSQLSQETIEEFLLFWEEKDLFVQSPTRHEKPISQVAENITVVTAKEIEDMNAHTVAEVLNRVTGVFVDFLGQDFGSISLLRIQGSQERHVLVLVDGVVWNFLGGGNAETNSIPVRIIERIEVIKGPASSAWGSSLGGVVNIITKNAGSSRAPSGSINASYGKRKTQDNSAEMSGKTGPVGYYLFAGKQESNGLRNNRFFDNYGFYAKLDVPLSRDVKFGFTTGYSYPRLSSGELPRFDLISRTTDRAFFATASLDAALSQELSLKVALNSFRHKFVQNNTVLGAGLYGAAGDLFREFIFDEETRGGNAKLVWTHGRHTAVFGAEINNGELDQTTNVGPLYQGIGVPATSVIRPGINKWAVFANDTITLGRFTVTPGIRYDDNNVTGPFTSPSLGATYKLAEKTILRTSVARGFTVPPLTFTSGGGVFLDPNPSLGPEKVWSYQAGMESGVTDYLWTKLTLFRHDMEDNLVKDKVEGKRNFSVYNNRGNIKRQGLELEAETVPFHNVSFKAGFAYVRIKPSSPSRTTVNYAYNAGVKYDDRKSFMAQLFGHYTWWDLGAENAAKYDAFIWDLNLSKKVYSWEKAKAEAEVFLTAHNLFNGFYYTFDVYKNPGRWVEAGVKFRF